MKNNVYTLGLLGLILSFNVALSQVSALNAKKPQDIRGETKISLINDKMIKYSQVNDQDVMWYKIVWEKIDLDEKINQKLYYPIDTLRVGVDRRSLFHVLISNIKSGKITDVYADSYFNESLNYQDIEQSLSKIDTLDAGYEQINAGEKLSREYVVKTTLRASDIQEIRIKGMWYFDRRVGLLRYRVLGIAPVSRDVNFLQDPKQPFVELFWVWYSGAREILHKAKVFSSDDAIAYISFDQIFTTRRFNGIIYKEDNVYNDRSIKDYIKDNAYLQLIEAKRIKDGIRDHEEDMWVY